MSDTIGKINLDEVATLLALRTGDSQEEARNFLKEMFAIIAETLEAGDQVKIRDIGVFKCIGVEARKSVNVATGDPNEIPAHRKVVFIPAKDLAAAVNEPFDMFETIEIPELSDEHDESTEKAPNCTEEVDGVVALESDISEDDVSSETAAESVNRLPEDSLQNELTQDDEPHDEPQDDEPQDDEPQDDEPQGLAQDNGVIDVEELEGEGPTRHKGRFGIGFLTGFVAAAVLAGVGVFAWYWFFARPEEKSISCDEPVAETQAVSAEHRDSSETPASVAVADPNDEPTAIQPVQSAESHGDDVPTAPSDSKPSTTKVYDVISHTRFLTTMAKDHYGNYNLWPYIYEENKAILGHPDRIKPGTRVVIPPLSKYGVNPESAEDIRRAKQKGVAIYARYK